MARRQPYATAGPGDNPMKKNEDRKVAEQAFLSDRGRITNKELAKRLGVHPATVARWKKIDEWDLKLVQSVTSPEGAAGLEEDFFKTDVRHITLLNERIDSYLKKKELLPSEILELAEAKYHLMNCMEIISDQMRYPVMDEFQEEDDNFD
jgi:Phage terminase small subunit